MEIPYIPRHEQKRPRQTDKITSNIVVKMGKGEDISIESLRKICIVLGCEIGNTMEVNAVDGKKLL